MIKIDFYISIFNEGKKLLTSLDFLSHYDLSNLDGKFFNTFFKRLIKFRQPLENF